jgi:tRNA modification GTPase
VVATQAKIPDIDDTIVALSSAAGAGARGIVRLSGKRSLAVVAAVCTDLAAPAAGHFASARLCLPGFAAPIAADVYRFAAPRSYTGQDVVEIHALSCPPILDALLAACQAAGARAAGPGEFTMRAFLAGKLDLTRAEAVMSVIDAGDRDQLRHALRQLAGGMAQPLALLRDDLLNLLADVEAGLDFTEEGIHFISADDLLKRLARGMARLVVLHKQLAQRALGVRPFRVVLAGKPNAGKSSLFNALAGKPAALVSAEAGTTRDYLQCVIEADGVPIELVDTAGLRLDKAPDAAIDAIGQQAQAATGEQAREADLMLWCRPCDEPDPAPLAGEPCMVITTKADLAPSPDGAIATSAATGAGLLELRRLLGEQVRRAGHDSLTVSLSRCRHHLDAALQHLRCAHALVLEDQLPELLALELRLGLEELGALVGAVYTDDLLDRIFSRFCVGK